MKKAEVFDFHTEMRKARLSRTTLLLQRFVFWGALLFLCIGAYGLAEREKVTPDMRGVQVPEEVYEGVYPVAILKADAREHFVFAGTINGKKVKFFYDTGATNVTIPDGVAKYLGLSRGKSYQTRTSNGSSISYRTKLHTVSVGGIELDDIEAGISEGLEGDEILLGMSFLQHVEIKQSKNSLELVYKK